jgi:predicted transcriptional regulator
MRPKGDVRHKIMAAILNKELGYPQQNIAKLMGVEQSTISSWIQMGILLMQNKQMEKEIYELRNQLNRLGYTEPKALEDKIVEIL